MNKVNEGSFLTKSGGFDLKKKKLLNKLVFPYSI